jgi:hypothetical protein
MATDENGAQQVSARRWWRRLTWIAAGACWLGAVGTGLFVLMQYDNTPGDPARAPQRWPSASAIARQEGRPTLLMLAHPQCDCTRASLGELAELLARAPGRARAYVLFVRPEGVPAGWERSGLWDRAASIPDVTVMSDPAGFEALRFGVQTSGQTLLYDETGALVFSGGITAARGKSGNSAGRAAIVAWLNGETPEEDASPVFGCYLLGPVDPLPPPDGHDHDTRPR